MLLDSQSPASAPWYRLSRLELFLGIVPAALALFIGVVCFGNDSGVSILAHSFVALLTLPGFIALEFGRLVLMRGSLHGDRWDLLSAPLSMFVVVSVLRILRKLREGSSPTT